MGIVLIVSEVVMGAAMVLMLLIMARTGTMKSRATKPVAVIGVGAALVGIVAAIFVYLVRA